MTMKKLIPGLLCLAALLAPVSAQAEGLSVKTEVDVTVTYTEEELQGSTGLGTGGTITLQDGTEVKVQAGSSADSDIRVAVVPVTQEDAEAYAYVTGCMETYGEKPYAFYILFYRDGKEVTPSAPVTLAAAAPDGYGESVLYSFAGAGAVQEAAGKPAGGAWTFTVSDSRYFAAVLPKGDQTEPSTPSTEPDETEPSVTPGTETETETEPTTTPGTETETEPSTTPGTETETETELSTTPGTGDKTGTAGTTAAGTKGNGGGTDKAAQSSAAKTGDEMPTGLWLLAFAASCSTLLAAFGKKRKPREKS